MFEIKKGVPLPSKSPSATSGIMAVLRKLEMGDSFTLKWEGDSPPRIVRNTLYRAASRAGIGITVQQAAEKEFGVWRTR
jgi:hypothetical protein